ncbi:MAG: hypothetical protein JKX73_08185 [Flavobacteriales bacterium]|nr:hypothetical protein [Flavobacteriales bacterium]
MNLSDQDLSLITDSKFLLAKVEVTSKINGLMEATRSELQALLGSSDFVFPSDVNLSHGKISRGEFYKSLPYFVLDYPASFSKKDIFAFRTMFWWGNFFSCTLHLQGLYLDEHRDSLVKNAGLLLGEDLYIGVGDTPWEYHYETDNYQTQVDASRLKLH